MKDKLEFSETSKLNLQDIENIIKPEQKDKLYSILSYNLCSLMRVSDEKLTSNRQHKVKFEIKGIDNISFLTIVVKVDKPTGSISRIRVIDITSEA
ncbi:MAG: hypothetical protein DRG78_04655 [Epsilonproteobacteria bacterium]|nr:MAG: hypothetical protein DRG78_04655 [Campylobacterota bacterium]